MGGGADTGHRATNDALGSMNVSVFILLTGGAAQLVIADQLAPGKKGFFFQPVNVFKANEFAFKKVFVIVVKTVFGDSIFPD